MTTPARIPVNLLTGFLGVGKSTAIGHLLTTVPAGERWAVLVNEFGQVAVDGAALDADPARITVRELPGGCLCCTLGTPLRVTLTRLIREVRPDRLLIEPSGVGHPARVLDTLRSGGLGSALEPRASICLVDPRQLADPRVTGHPVFIDQVELADVLVASKQDLVPGRAMAAFSDWAGALYPAKSLIGACSHGALNPGWLDLPPAIGRQARFAGIHHLPDAAAGNAHGQGDSHVHAHMPGKVGQGLLPDPGKPLGHRNRGQGREACGWIFSPEDSFKRTQLLQLLEGLTGPDRIKGVFRCGRDWLLVDRVNDGIQQRACGWRTDSRLEILAPVGEAPDWDMLELDLLACLA